MSSLVRQYFLSISSGASLVSQGGGKIVININAGYTFYLAKGKK